MINRTSSPPLPFPLPLLFFVPFPLFPRQHGYEIFQLVSETAATARSCGFLLLPGSFFSLFPLIGRNAEVRRDDEDQAVTFFLFSPGLFPYPFPSSKAKGS